MRLRRSSFVGIAVLSSVIALAAQQGDRVQFRSGVELVQLDVVVLDGKRQPVRGLTESDFTVLDNGVAAPVRAFSYVELTRPRPSEAVWSNDAPRDIATNQVGEEEGRLVIILMDRSIPLEGPTVTARKIATNAVESLGPYDLAAVISTNNNAVQTSAVQDLTADRARLLRAINAADPSTNISAEASVLMHRGALKHDVFNDPRCPCGLCVAETITRVAKAVQNTPRRRKVLLFIGSSMIWQASRPISDAFNDVSCSTRVKEARATMLAAIDLANLTVHSIDPQGIVTTPGAQASTGAVPLSVLVAKTTSNLAERENLSVLPDRTGGRVVVSNNRPEDSIPDILHETDAYYVIGIERAVSNRPDNTRSIEVKVKGKGLRVVAQRQYTGTPPASNAAATETTTAAAPPATEAALASLLPRADVPLALAVTPFASPENGKPIVRVNVDAGGFARGEGTMPLEIAVLAVDQNGRPVTSAKQNTTITAKRLASGALIEVPVQSYVELAPGEYGVRVAVSDSASGRTASVFSEVSVPKFDDASLSMSGVSVETGSAAVATTRRAFKRDEQVRAVFQIYQGTARSDALAPVSVRVRILDAKGAAVRDQSLPFAESSFVKRRADAVITLPLSKLTPGEYLLQLDAGAHNQTSGRAVRFIVLN